MKFVKICLWSIILTFFVTAPFTVVHAKIVPECGGDGQQSCTICDIVLGIDNVIAYIVGLVGVTVIVIIVIAGIMYIVSAGNQGMVTMAKSAMKNAIIGLVVVLAAFVIIHFILRAISQGGTPTINNLNGVGENVWTFTCNNNTSSAPDNHPPGGGGASGPQIHTPGGGR